MANDLSILTNPPRRLFHGGELILTDRNVWVYSEFQTARIWDPQCDQTLSGATADVGELGHKLSIMVVDLGKEKGRRLQLRVPCDARYLFAGKSNC